MENAGGGGVMGVGLASLVGLIFFPNTQFAIKTMLSATILSAPPTRSTVSICNIEPILKFTGPMRLGKIQGIEKELVSSKLSAATLDFDHLKARLKCV